MRTVCLCSKQLTIGCHFWQWTSRDCYRVICSYCGYKRYLGISQSESTTVAISIVSPEAAAPGNEGLIIVPA